MYTLTYYFGEYGEETFEYEIDSADVERAIIKLKILTKEELEIAYNEQDGYDRVVEENEDALKEFFEDEAIDQYNDEKALSKNPESYYGVSRKD